MYGRVKCLFIVVVAFEFIVIRKRDVLLFWMTSFNLRADICLEGFSQLSHVLNRCRFEFLTTIKELRRRSPYYKIDATVY